MNPNRLLASPAGSGEEQAVAATVFALLCIQLGGGDEAEEGFRMLRPVLTTVLIDGSASMAARQSVSHQHLNKLDSGSVWQRCYSVKVQLITTSRFQTPW